MRGGGALRAVNRDKPILAPLVREISWAKNRVILGRCTVDLAREFYLEALDSGHRLDGENPPVGIIICRGKEKTVVEYALRTATRPLGVATCTVVPQLPEDYRNDLPSPEQIAERLRAWKACGGRSTDEIR